jgi:pyridoxal 5'-phosphate synthase pdxS subunit
MQKGGVIMDVVTREQARIAEDAGAVAVMALEAVPADIRKRGGVARMADPAEIEAIIDEVSIPVMGKSRIGHTAEAKILEAVGVDMIDESEVLTPADDAYHIDKRDFTAPFVCGARNLPEALRRIDEGAAMIRTKGEAGTGDVNQAVTHQRAIKSAIRELEGKTYEERERWAREHEAPADLVHETAEMGRLPVVNFAAGGIATPADASLMMMHGCDGIFVGSGIFGAEDPVAMGDAIVEAVNNWDDPERLAEIAAGTGKGMKGESNADMPEEEKLQGRGV